MISPRHCPRRRPGFTLVELLTVVGIIALLIGILMPALANARRQARKVSIAGTIKAIGDGLEMFRNDFGEYPDSSHRLDPITDYPSDGAPETDLSGAHWLARALLGHDFQGMDPEAAVLRDGAIPANQINMLPPPGDINPDRKRTYLDGKHLARDTDPAKFKQTGTPDTGRPVVFDVYRFPIIYYRANPRARAAMAADPTVTAVYNQADNIDITGCDAACGGWDFAAVGAPNSQPVHAIGQFGSFDPLAPSTAGIHDPPVDIAGKTFVDYIHNHAAGHIGGVAKPVNADSYILISSGEDGVYGTDDDVNNFSGALSGN